MGKDHVFGSSINPWVFPPSLWSGVISKLKAKINSWGGHWLTMAGKLILVKVVLSTFPTFQSSLMLATKSILAQISKILRDFLWSCGKGYQNKLHLVWWDVLIRPFSIGGLHIWDPGLANIALSGKLLWQLFANKNHHVSKNFQMNYIKGVPMRYITSSNTLPCTTI